MLKKIFIAIFWLAFFSFFLYKLIPKYKYLSNDTLKHWGSNTIFDNSIFALHIVAYSRCELQYGCAINNDACNNMQCKNAVVKCSVASPMFKTTIGKVLVLRKQLV